MSAATQRGLTVGLACLLVVLLVPPLPAQNAQKVAVLWVDPLLSLQEIGTRSGIVNILTRAKSAGIGAIALGVKTNIGATLYRSNLAPTLQEWEGKRVRFDIDPIEVFLEEGKKRQIQIYAVFPLFSEGHLVERLGPVFENRQNWQTEVYAVNNERPEIIPISEWAQGSYTFVNPLLPEVQQYELALVKEFLGRYSVDGLIFDKVQFAGIEADFSERSRALFAAFLGDRNQIQWWPKDVFEWRLVDEEWEPVPGPLFREWIQFRAQGMRDFLQRLVNEVNQLDPTLPIGLYVGAWYPTYYEYGLNWASEDNIVEEEWAPRQYYETAVAEMLNYLVVGCYFPRITTEESESVGAEWWMSVEGSALIAMEVVDQACPVYGSILVPLFGDDRERFKQALQTALAQTNGLYLYDLSAIMRYNYWDEIAGVLRGSSRQRTISDR